MSLSACIATLVASENYGNRLQNFALQETLRALGVDHVETLPNTPGTWNENREPFRTLGKLTVMGPREVAANLASTLTRPRLPGGQDLAGEELRQFDRDHITYATTTYTQLRRGGNARDFARTFDFWVVGSDQVWNPHFGLGKGLDFLSFAEAEQRIAYSASFGVDEIPGVLRKRYSRGISGIPHISVREHRAAQMIHELTGRDVPVTADPTMLVPAARWRSLASDPAGVGTRRPYVLSFFLGGGPASAVDAIRPYAVAQDLEIVDLAGPRHARSAGNSPWDFLGWIKNAELIVTDSFHAAVFAILFHVPPVLVPRGAMNSRLITLTQHAGIPYVDAPSVATMTTIAPVDWAAVDLRIASLREMSLQYLRSAIARA